MVRILEMRTKEMPVTETQPETLNVARTEIECTVRQDHSIHRIVQENLTVTWTLQITPIHRQFTHPILTRWNHHHRLNKTTFCTIKDKLVQLIVTINMDNNYKLDQELFNSNRTSGLVLQPTSRTTARKAVSRCLSTCQLASSKWCTLNRFTLKILNLKTHCARATPVQVNLKTNKERLLRDLLRCLQMYL